MIYIYICICSICRHSVPQNLPLTYHPTTDLLNPAGSQLLGIQSALSRHALRSTQALQFRAREPRVRQPGKAPIYHTEHPKHRKVKSDWNHDRFICLPLRLLLSIYILYIHMYILGKIHTFIYIYICADNMYLYIYIHISIYIYTCAYNKYLLHNQTVGNQQKKVFSRLSIGFSQQWCGINLQNFGKHQPKPKWGVTKQHRDFNWQNQQWGCS